jgi:magnesium transporter
MLRLGHPRDRSEDASEMTDRLKDSEPRQRLQPILTLLERGELMQKVAHAEHTARPELVDSLVARQFDSEIRHKLAPLAPADVAHLLEMLPPRRRERVWHQVPREHAGEVLAAVQDTVADAMIAITERARLLEICWHADPETLNQVRRLIPADILEQLHGSLDPKTRAWLQASAHWAEGTVGHLISPDVVVVPASATIKDAFKAFRRLAEVPDQTDQLFVVDEQQRLMGALPITTLLVRRPREPVAPFMNSEVIRLRAVDPAAEAARAFEHHDLVSAPVVDDQGRLIGRVTADVILDYVRAEAEADLLNRDGLSGEEDLFGRVWPSAKRRWLWLSINLMTAFLASRVIGVFEDSIAQLVALATLMPIVASVGGNTGNQTVALFIRGLALDQIDASNIRYLALKEVAVSVINGLLWGGVIGAIACVVYWNWQLGAVMATATMLNLILAAGVGILVPVAMDRLGRDPAFGSSVVLTFITDSMGFFIFLGLATAFLLP